MTNMEPNRRAACSNGHLSMQDTKIQFSETLSGEGFLLTYLKTVPLRLFGLFKIKRFDNVASGQNLGQFGGPESQSGT